MARTKKQTLVNACERRRQIQEEIRRETLAAKQKKENFVVSHTKENHFAAGTNSHQNGVTVSGASHANLQNVNLEKMDNSGDFPIISVNDTVVICVSASVRSQANMSSMSQVNDTSSLSEGGLPKAVICIPDICRSPTKSINEEPNLLDCRELSPRVQGVWGKIASDSPHGKPRDDPVRKRCCGTKQSEKSSPPEDVIASLRSLKAASEKVREEKRRKSRPESCTTPLEAPSQGRRSPRRHSPVSSDSHQGSNTKGHKDSRSVHDEKPKVNIFTDNLGLDLGKRIRSPRRLSEDMIALPIFSVRRWNNSPKENYAGSKAVEEMSISDGMETLSLHVNLNNESFKSPGVSPTSSKKSSTCGSSQKSPSSSGSSKSTLPDEPLLYIGSKSTEDSISPLRHCGTKSNILPLANDVSVDFICEKSEHQQLVAENVHEDKPSKSNLVKNSMAAVSQQLQFRQETKILGSSNQKYDHCDGDGDCFDSTPNLTCSVDGLLESKKVCSNSVSLKIKKDKSKPKLKEDVEKLMSSICRELMSDVVLIKCESKCMKTSNDSDINVKIEGPLDKGLECKFNKENSVKDLVSVTINCNNNFQKINSDTEREAASNKVPCAEASILGVPQDTTEEKPLSSLLCAMLVGGTEVAHSYSQERGRIKPQVVEASDAEFDMSTGSSSHAATSVPAPRPLSESPDINNQKHYSTISKVVKSGESDAQEFVENRELDRLVSVCDKIDDTLENTDATTSTCELNDTDAIALGNIEKQDISGSTVENEPFGDVTKDRIDLSSQFKKLNEGVLKLMDIDLEEEFIKDLEVDDDMVVECDENLTAGVSKLHETSLYGLISALGSRLRETDSHIPFSSPVDIELVEDLMQSCPKSTPSVIPKLKTLTRLNRIHQRLEEENLKDVNNVQNRIIEAEICPALKDRRDICSGFDHESSVITARNIYLDSDGAPPQAMKPVETVQDRLNDKGESVMNVDLDVLSGNLDTQVSTFGTISSGTAAASSSLNDSHCDQSRVSSVTSPVLLGPAREDEQKQVSEVLQMSTEDTKNRPNSSSSGKTLEMAARHSFQKSKTCDDFNERAVLSPPDRARTLRRVNSSPQMSVKPSLPSSSPLSPVTCATKDSHTKSKLGSKIPVPGTSYTTKYRKSWRTPRAIVEPKPLSVLSYLENKSSHPTSVFTCKNLQTYLNIPSNRIIVTEERRDEMKILDATAQEEEEKIEKMIEENDRKSDDESVDYRNIEPDFDEVDGMLFMSFSSEVELRAHVRVEKALEWDKDDTMLRVSRAKAFEEAKALNEDMGHFKLKHLRGQHMRWKKYRRLYSNEVKVLLEAQKAGKSLDKLTPPKKTSDISKIKGWKKKNAEMRETINDTDMTFSWSHDSQNYSFDESKEDIKPAFFQSSLDDEMLYMSEYLAAEDYERLDLSPRSRRRQGFSHQKAHRQLFRELNMDWQDRMIHRKLGGWSLKGNRPQAFSSAAKKRQEKKFRESDAVIIDIKDLSAEASSLEEAEVEATEFKGYIDGQKRKKLIKIVYPLLTEKMVRNALKTLETGDIQRGARKKKRPRQTSSQLPALTPFICKLEPEAERPQTPLNIEAGNVDMSLATSLLTSPSQQSLTSFPSSSVSYATTPLEIDLLDEPVMEGVDVASENISSPSVHETSSIKSCGKPGCRYGCICHLCFVSETSARLPSPVAKQPDTACDKEYCRLGCICDSIDPDKQVSNKNHCRRPSCMLQCVCSEPGSFDGNEDIPYLPSMKRRPKPGERFSNLPQREKTHRSAKNVDAVTRKAMMLYETSEIYCERVERVRRRPEASSSPTTTSFDSTLQTCAISPVSHMSVTCSTATFDIDITSEPSEDSSLQADMLFSPETPATSEATIVTISYPLSTCSTGLQHQHPPRNIAARISKPTFILDDIRQTVPNMEPSAHKRKRKSHPLSDEIFISSTCARTQPFKYMNCSKEAHFTATSEDTGNIIEISHPSTIDPKSPSESATSVSAKRNSVTLTEADSEPREILPKISSVHTLTAEQNTGLHHWENMEPDIPLSHSVGTSSGTGSRRWSKNMTVIQQSSQCSSNSGGSGNLRQPYGWHKSMVCLKARAPPPSQDQEEEDVKEEDEVKLLEFAANCNWEGAKREILAKVAQCLTRGQYPQPRTMNVCEFVVEILPKAQQPSHIPPELRAKLPGQMYSIRVRITRRESINRREDDADVIDLSGLSPVKAGRGIDCGDSSVGINMKEVPSVCSDHKSGAIFSDSSFLSSSSFGISGLSKLFITSPPASGQHSQNSGSGGEQSVNPASSKPESAPNSRRSSTDSTSLISFLDDNKQAADLPALPIKALPSLGAGIKLKGSSFMRLGSGSPLKTTIGSAFNSESIKTVTTTAVSSNIKLTKSASQKYGLKSLNMAASKQAHVAKAVPSGVSPIFGPFSAKDVKYMIPGKDGTMQFIEVGSAVDKNKKLIAVPITLSKTSVDLKGKQSTMVALPVSSMGQNRIVPIVNSQVVPSQVKTSPAQQIVLRLPAPSHSVPGVSSVRHPVVLQPLQSSIKGQPPRFQVVPLQIGNCMTVSQAKMMTAKTAHSSKAATLTPKPLNSSDEMIMVFDAAHIRASSHQPGSSTVTLTSSSKTDKRCESSNNCASLTNSREGPIMSSEISPTKLQTHLNGTIDLTSEKDVRPMSAGSNRAATGADDNCDIPSNDTSDQLVNKVSHTSVSDKLDTVPDMDCSINLYNSSTDVFSDCDVSSSQSKQGEKCVLTEVGDTNSVGTISDTAEWSLSEAVFEEDILYEIITSTGNITSSVCPSSHASVRDNIPNVASESVLSGSKRHFPTSTALEEPLSPCTKKPFLAVENPLIVDEDSVASMNSMFGVQLAAASPLSNIDRPKSVMSAALSTGSSDDLLILLSSEEDVDVGEEDKPDNIISYKTKAERALENDHGSMYIKMERTKKVTATEESVKSNGLRHENQDMSISVDKEQHKHAGKNLQKVRHHNQLERLRRSRMRVLFDDLQRHVLRERGLPKDHVMSKVKVLVEAKKVVLHLSKCVLEGDKRVQKYERLHQSLLAKLADMKANLIQHNVSTEAISSVMKEASAVYSSQQSINSQLLQSYEDTQAESPQLAVIQPDPVEADIEDSEMVNLVSPSTEGEKVSDRPDVTTPVYEDISDPEDSSVHKYEGMSDTEDMAPRIENVSSSKDEV